MKTVGIICEYNPLHLGHLRQLAYIRETLGEDTGIVCLMSGDYVQRGAPAMIDKGRRAEAAVRCGADLVLELPVTVSLSSAEGFAAGGVGILSSFCQTLCFGAETPDPQKLMQLASVLLCSDFKEQLRIFLDQGLSFPAARQAALAAMGMDAQVLAQPNNILAVEYCKALLSQASSMVPLVIHRPGCYHDSHPDPTNPSATALRSLLEAKAPWEAYVPREAAACFRGAALHTMANGEKAVLARLRCMTDAEFEALPHSSEGLWRKFMHAARKEASVEQILSAVKSKRYTRSRLDRMLLCAFLGIPRELLEAPVPYVRALAFSDLGREILKQARSTGAFPNIGQVQPHPYQDLEDRCGALYGLFAPLPEPPGLQRQARVFCLSQKPLDSLSKSDDNTLTELYREAPL